MGNLQLTPTTILVIIGLYFLMLIVIAQLTSRNATNDSFFMAGRQSPWYLVAIGMIGASISGVTFVSVPGWVEGRQFSYLQTILGYLLGYYVIASVLMPMYYRLNLVSIYGYLEQRLGFYSYKTGSAFFLISRSVGSAFRLFLMSNIMQEFVARHFGVPFWLTVSITLGLIWVYTYRGGIKTIIWTDTLQSLFLLTSLVLSVYFLCKSLGLGIGDALDMVRDSQYSQIFHFDEGWGDKKNFFKQFLAGASICIVMSGLDQDIMQKNLTCKNIGDAQKNMFWFAQLLAWANVLFVFLGALLYLFIAQKGIVKPASPDLLFPTVALYHQPAIVGVLFLLGIIASTYASSDSALASLTTAFCIDFLDFNKRKRDEKRDTFVRTMVHLGFTVLLFFLIMIFHYINDRSTIEAVFTAASYTYGPLLGLFAFGFFTKRSVRDGLVPFIGVSSVVATYFINKYSKELLWGYKFDFELLILNGLITFVGLLLFSRRPK